MSDYSYDRRIASERFERLFDLEQYMWDQGRRDGWRKSPHPLSGDTAYMKQFSGVWYQLDWSTSVWSDELFIHPTNIPKAIHPDSPDYKEYKSQVTEHLPIKGFLNS